MEPKATGPARESHVHPEGLQKVLGKITAKNFTKADEVREFPKGKVEMLTFEGVQIGRATLEPGWRWSESLKNMVGTESCEAPHFQYHVSGILRVKMNDGTEIECKPGDISMIPPGHDAWVVGNEPVVIVDFQGMANYAKPATKH